MSDDLVINIDGKEIKAKPGQMILQAAMEAGIYIPYLCYFPKMKPQGSCRACMVEVDSNGRKMTVASCTTPPMPDAEVTTNSEEIQDLRKNIIELLVRPTGLIDPVVEIQPIKEQVDDLFKEIKIRAEKNQRTLVTTLTKRFSEDLTEHFTELGLKVKYLHSDIETLERSHIIRELRLGEFDALIGINLLREGLDIPEVSLVAILDADKEGFLRSTTSLIQTSGRAARNIDGKVIFYADTVTQSMQKAIDEMNRRRTIQTEYNVTHQIIPESIRKSIQETLVKQEKNTLTTQAEGEEDELVLMEDAPKLIKSLEKKMHLAAKNLEFEKAALLRDRVKKLREKDLSIIS